jgi:PKD repeat protein
MDAAGNTAWNNSTSYTTLIPAISIFKTVISPDENGDCIVNSAGDTIPYRIVIKNEGNVDLTGVKIDDPLISLSKPDGDDFDLEVLNPGETWVYTGVYKLTSKDVKNKDSIKNTATVSCNELSAESSSVETPIVKKPGLIIYKSVIGIDETGDKIINEPGEIVEYQVAVKNKGNMDLTEVSVSDFMVELEGAKGDHDDQETLSPGETWIYKGNYEVTQADIDNIKNGHSYIKNTATVSCDELPDKSSSYVLPIYVPPVVTPEVPPEIIIPGPKNEKVLPEANFRTNINAGKCPLAVQFTDLSQNAESRSWDFNNDGTADSYDMNPSYVYTVPGTYTAKLTVTNPNGTDYETATIKAWQPDSSGSKRNGHHGTGTGKAVIIRKNTVSDSNAGTGENGALADNQNGYPGSKQDGGNIVKNINPTSEQKGNTSSPANESEKTPGFEIICGITGLLAVYLYGRK